MPRQNYYHGPAFLVTQGTTQGRLVSSTLFNAVVDNVIRTWMAMTVEDQRVALDGLVENAGHFLGIFYVDDGMVGSIDSNWLQHLMNILIGLSRRYGLVANVSKSCTMTCEPGALRSGMSENAKELKCMGLGASYRQRIRQWIPCP